MGIEHSAIRKKYSDEVLETKTAMRITGTALLFVIIASFTGCKEKDQKTTVRPEQIAAHAELVVTAQSGLHLRSHPSVESPSLALMPFAAKVQFIRAATQDDNPHYDAYGPPDSTWFFVRYQSMQGWAYSSFLKPVRQNADQTALRRFINQPFAGRSISHIGNNVIQQLIATLGAPASHLKEHQRNPHDLSHASMDTIHRITWKGVSAIVYSVSSDEKEILSMLTITQFDELNSGVRPENTVSDIITLFGIPGTYDADRLVYDAGEGLELPVTFYFSENILKKITIAIGTD